MTITALDSRTALVLIDLQKGIVRLPTAHPADAVVSKAAELAAAFRKQGLPVVLVHVTFAADGGDALKPRADHPRPPMTLPADFADFAEELQLQDSDIVVTKHHWSAFYGTDLELHLRRRGITGIVLGGISTSVGVESTAREAHDRAFNVTIASDALTDLHLPSHEHSLTQIFPRLAEVGTTEEILAVLAANHLQPA
ncbi:hydrolase [Deinococcus roseus]|uniref:Hydrolase n=1 Tax=Deinococcus roseus TaxID=392414 RepID=A0ABQ2D145_9DEIO|nr:hydrolase [Deinococcus roseus]GGJ40944.1 hydrolase [Deinococcus roseus]